MNELIYNGKHSRDFGIYISGSGTFNSPERDDETISIPGKNGDLEVSHNRFKNIAVEYPAFIVNSFKDNAAAARAWLLAASGYHRLEDTYHSEYFRLGRFTGPIDFDMKFLNRAGEFKLQFNCKPQRFLKSGEEIITKQVAKKTISGNPITVSANANGIKSVKLHGKTTQSGKGDPSPTNIRPIYGVGQFDKKVNISELYAISGQTGAIAGQTAGGKYRVYFTTLKDIPPSPSHVVGLIIADKGKSVSFDTLYSVRQPNEVCIAVSVAGNISVLVPDASSTSEVFAWIEANPITVYYQSTSYSTATQVYCGLSITDANGYHGYAAGPTAPLYDGDTVDFATGECKRTKGYIASYAGEVLPGKWISDRDVYAAGATPTTGAQVVYELSTPTTETVPISEPITNAAGTVTISAENTLELVYEMLENGFIYNPTEFTALPLIRVYGTAPGTLTVGNTIVQINTINEYVDLDCELQDAFKGITNCNGNVYAPDFPTLPPGGTGISFSGGIAKIEIKPRWWTV